MELPHFLILTIGFIGLTEAYFQNCNNENSTRLQGGKDETQGRLEVCRNGFWQTVCEQNFGQSDAAIVCRELGLSDQGAKPLTSGYTKTSDSNQWSANIACLGNEERLTDCPTLGVKCELPEEGELRILGGKNASSGRLEVFKEKRWGTVCDDYWSRNDAQVACHQLGFSTEGAQAVRAGFRKRDVGDNNPILLDNLLCSGSEQRLIDCKQYKPGLNNCDHFEDAGVICTKKRANILIKLLEELLEN